MAAIGSGLGLGKAIEGGMNAMGRQPEAIGQIQTAMIIGCAFIEALTIYALIATILGVQQIPMLFVLVGKLTGSKPGPVPDTGPPAHAPEGGGH